MPSDMDSAAIRAQVDCELPELLPMDERVLFLRVSSWRISVTGSSFRRDDHDQHPGRALDEAAEALAESFLRQLRQTICEPDNKRLIADVIDAANVAAVVTLISQSLGQLDPSTLPSATVPSGIVAAAVLILKMGLNRFCRGYAPDEGAPAKALERPAPRKPRTRRPRPPAR